MTADELLERASSRHIEEYGVLQEIHDEERRAWMLSREQNIDIDTALELIREERAADEDDRACEDEEEDEDDDG